MPDQKKIMRKKILELRKLLFADEVYEKSSMIIEKLLNLKEFDAGDLIMCYIEFRNEVATRDFIKLCFTRGKRVAIPLIVNTEGNQKEILACEIHNIENEIESGAYGIFEPKRDMAKMVEPLEIDLAVVPGVAFDMKKHRIGYGGGCYDRFLKKLKLSCIKVGIAFELQIVDEIPADKHDIPMDMVITESRLI